MLTARYTYVPVDKYSFCSNTVDLMVNTTKAPGRRHHCPAVFAIYLLCPNPCKEKVASLIRKAQQCSFYPAKAPTSSSLTATPSEPSLVCRVFFFTRGALFSLDSLETGSLRLLGTFFWGSQALSSLSSSEADDLKVKQQKNFQKK